MEIDKRSPSSRRAWIEICWLSANSYAERSPSSRRAWIEIASTSIPVISLKSRPPRGGRG